MTTTATQYEQFRDFGQTACPEVQPVSWFVVRPPAEVIREWPISAELSELMLAPITRMMMLFAVRLHIAYSTLYCTGRFSCNIFFMQFPGWVSVAYASVEYKAALFNYYNKIPVPKILFFWPNLKCLNVNPHPVTLCFKGHETKSSVKLKDRFLKPARNGG